MSYLDLKNLWYGSPTDLRYAEFIPGTSSSIQSMNPFIRPIVPQKKKPSKRNFMGIEEFFVWFSHLTKIARVNNWGKRIDQAILFWETFDRGTETLGEVVSIGWIFFSSFFAQCHQIRESSVGHYQLKCGEIKMVFNSNYKINFKNNCVDIRLYLYNRYATKYNNWKH